MKRMLFLLLLLLGSNFSIHSLAAEMAKSPDEDAQFVEARKLFWAGRYAEAEKEFKTYLASNPEHRPTRNFLKMIEQSKKYNPDNISLTRKRLESIRVNQIEFNGTEWSDVVSSLQDLANPKVNGKPPSDYINFIGILPSGFSKKVHLNLRDVSLLKVIEYSCEQAGLRCVIDTWAVIIDVPEQKK
jgi:hypothetical protein